MSLLCCDLYRDKKDSQNGLLNSSHTPSSPHSSHPHHHSRQHQHQHAHTAPRHHHAHEVVEANSDSEGSSSWEWVYYDEVECLSCPSSSSSDSEDVPAANGLGGGFPRKANAVEDNGEWEYYEEQDAYGPEEYDQELPVATYDSYRTQPRQRGMPKTVPHGTYPEDPLHYGHQHSKKTKAAQPQPTHKG